ncbi:MAG: hypothetical protein M3362_12730 [Acidobacteriota bacterium]|nr:hypothetical protein [Acidobacteriota bacterium]
MNEQRKREEAIGDALLLVSARLYLNLRKEVPYSLQTRVISQMVNNDKLIEIAAREGIKGEIGERLCDAFEVEIAHHYFNHGFRDTKLWLWGIFDKYFDLKEEVRRILQPTPQDKLERQIRGVLKTALSNGQIDVQHTAQMIVKVLRGAGSI